MALPPGTSLHPVIQTALFALRPTEFLDWLHRRYGDIFMFHTVLFGPEVTLCDPDLIKQVFTGDPDTLRAGEANEFMEPLLGPRSVLLLDGPKHLRERRLLMPPFHGERMLAYARTMRAITEDVLGELPLNEPIALHPHLQRITIEIILRTVFGVEEGRDCEELREALTLLLDRESSLLSSIATAPALRKRFFGLTPWETFLRDVARADALIRRQIARRREQGSGGDDILGMLLAARDEDGHAMTEDELRDELMTLLVAGHETTASMLAWTFDRVLGERDVMEKLVREIDGAWPDLGKTDYLDATIKEVLRLYPVIPAVGRRLKAPMKLGGYDLPAGSLIVPSIYLTHRMPSIYPDPSAFKPERFLDKKPDPYAWLPFGGGVRRCIGMAFALFEMRIVVATALHALTMRKVRREPGRFALRAFTFVPRGGAKVVITERRKHHDKLGNEGASRAEGSRAAHHG